MQIISCASYYGTGSSAVTDFLSEFDMVKSLTNYEFRFVQDPDGISELEYNLVENINRHNSGHALKRFKRLVDYYGNHLLVKRYEPFFSGKWKKISYQYIDELTDFKYRGAWQYDYYDRGPLFEFLAKLPDRILQRTIWRGVPDKEFNLLKKEITYASNPGEEKFLQCTRRYMTRLMEAANSEKLPYVMVDQIVPSSNLSRFLRYFEDIKVFVVDRDPRDVYLCSKYNWRDRIVPKESIELFCKWFAYTHAHRKVDVWDNNRVMLIRFEDLIYKYDETTTKIMDWLGFTKDHHVKPRSCFIPEKSIKNTRIWMQHPEYKVETDKIAALLPEYLYDYSFLKSKE